MDKSAIERYFAALIEGGTTLLSRIPRDRSKFQYWVPEEMLTDVSGWFISAANAIQIVAPAGSHFAEECKQTLADSRKEGHGADLRSTAVARMLGILRAADTDWKAGHLRRIEFVVAAATFDDFLEHAEQYHRGGLFREAAVLSSAVLEDAVRKTCEYHGVSWEGKTLFPRIDGLESANVLTKPSATRLKRWAEVRNRADHAEWERIDGTDVGAMISGIRAFIAEHM